ncbi:MAG: hypothetical protein MJA27_12715 [Pseudanabaenales cyanobacterium]|nr:hypothetical protein [Pseudanabaenales cyanobacterium]
MSPRFLPLIVIPIQLEVVDWENYSIIGVGRPQELITQQTLEKYRGSPGFGRWHYGTAVWLTIG